ncbi:MAG TPA: hypothetical protein VGN86_00530 [Pyrinomonadaceae bacterium]|jgi:drug/metabolite transporter (DMT)-like permease|nr:hypothetical protein [Pyrinomonadaceae bacterium]
MPRLKAHKRHKTEENRLSQMSGRRHAALVFGGLASLFYGGWGFFDKLASPQSLYVTNLIVYGVAFAVSLIGLKEKRGPSLVAFIAGVCGGGINALVLYSLFRNKLVLVYPFVSFGTIFFIAFSFFFLEGKFITQSKLKLVAGIVIALFGLVMCGIGLSGGFAGIDWRRIDVESISVGLLIAILTGLWVFFAFVTVTKQGLPPLAATTWVFAGSFVLAIMIALTNLPDLIEYSFSKLTVYAILGGLCMFAGELSTYFAFRTTPADSQRLEQSITVFLSNSELLPILVLSVLFLKEYSVEGAIGAVLVLGGLVLLNLAKDYK